MYEIGVARLRWRQARPARPASVCPEVHWPRQSRGPRPSSSLQRSALQDVMAFCYFNMRAWYSCCDLSVCIGLLTSDAPQWRRIMGRSYGSRQPGASTLRSNIFKAIIQKLALTRTLLLTLSDPHDEAKKIYIFKPVAIHARRTNLSTHLPTASPKNVRFQKFKAQMASRWLHRSACQRGHPVIFH